MKNAIKNTEPPVAVDNTLAIEKDQALRASVLSALKEIGSIKLTIAASSEVKSLVDKTIKEGYADLEKRMAEVVEAIRPVAKEVTITRPSGDIIIKELTHQMFAKILALVDAGDPVYLYGAAGAGKTTLAYQISVGLGMPYYPVYGGPTLTESKLLGYRNASTGHYVKGLCYDPYVSGGLLFIDEADVGEGLIGLNALLANMHYRFPDGEVVKRHPNFRVLAAGNTNWNGASGSYKRQAADGAFKDRFIRVQFVYDEQLEIALTPEEFHPWAKYVQEVRKYVATQTKDNRAIISPRAIFKGVKAIQSGAMTIQEAAETIVMVDLSDDIKMQVAKEVKAPVIKIAKEKASKKPSSPVVATT